MSKYKTISNILLCTGCLLVVGAVGFICYAQGHPEGSFPWILEITYLLYMAYIAITFFAFLSARFLWKKREKK
ncbi:MAG TPA: hypothetical protein DDY59_13375 [Lachnospiraceae bacterium]|nr:hypothetical protein [Lachnospiraceae bacterium]